jgi:hypothetical protein
MCISLNQMRVFIAYKRNKNEDVYMQYKLYYYVLHPYCMTVKVATHPSRKIINNVDFKPTLLDFFLL